MSREFYREFLFCFLFICGFKMRSAEFYPQVFQNMIITKGIFSVRQNVDWFECIKDCAVSEQCVSYNFEIASPRNSCELSKCGIRTNGGCSEEEVLRFSSGFVYQQLKESSKKGWDADCDVTETLPTTPPTVEVHYKDCSDALRQGQDTNQLYRIDPDGRGTFSVLCEQATSGGGWVIIQRRIDGSQDFYQSWQAYASGFGKLDGEFWLGLDRIHRLTQAGNSQLQIEVAAPGETQRGYVLYGDLSVSSRENLYRLMNARLLKHANMGDSLTNFHVGKPFSTKDNDNDGCANCSCAQQFKGAWWYKGKGNACLTSDLNSRYGSLSWSTYGYKITSTRIMIRRSDQ